jgi:hypothetical protein
MGSRLGEKIEGRCSALEKCVIEGEWRSEECFMSLEMFRAKTESEHAKLGKRFMGLKLEVSCINRFLEHESMEHAHEKSGILAMNESAFARQPSTP